MKEGIVAKCPKCNYERQPNNIECSRCGVVYEKYTDYVHKKRSEQGMIESKNLSLKSEKAQVSNVMNRENKMEQSLQKPLKDTELIKDAAKIMAYHIERGAKDFYQVSQKMIADFGEGVRPFLHEAWKMAQEQIKNQVDVAEELLKAEESNKNLASHIALELKAQMLVREGLSVKITRKQRIGIVISLVWLVIALAVSLSEESLPAFLANGILPVGVGWGIWWIFRTKE
jgi:hypothetical protein